MYLKMILMDPQQRSFNYSLIQARDQGERGIRSVNK